MRGNPQALKFDEMIGVLSQDEQLRQNKSRSRAANQAFIAHHRGKYNTYTYNN